MTHPLHEIAVDEALVRALLAGQHPDLAGLPLVRAAQGWDNVTFRLGDDLAVRLPARAVAAPLVEHEQRWLPVLAPLLPVAVPVPVRLGRPGRGFPWPWSVVAWIEGTPADELTAAERDVWAAELAGALAALHRPAPAEAPANPFRGVPLATRDDVVSARLAAHPAHDVLLDTWRQGLAAPAWDGPAVWLHGDPHPANLLAADDGLAGILDFGDVAAGDPASDLGAAWATFTATGRARFWAAYAAASSLSPDRLAALHVRARAWAAALVPPYTAHPDEHPGLAAAGAHALRELASDLR
ncbi:MAG: phosphotransferase [Cellulomonas sp. 73-92]|uniref:aminoglycoside phosphotransferase family protein n=1 Tax=Cellulomonas sp. 73-92 TaxID=1895740 RepID=UPI0009274CAF|nr:aminoglycoside phosphotransferase family protein [Cellulomonas sp. 73-92]OJV80373.1 MAG: phosphotransferase [Cellulomonas sp. 73-92]